MEKNAPARNAAVPSNLGWKKHPLGALGGPRGPWGALGGPWGGAWGVASSSLCILNHGCFTPAKFNANWSECNLQILSRLEMGVFNSTTTGYYPRLSNPALHTQLKGVSNPH